MKHPDTAQVLLMAHGWGYNHRFFDAFLSTLPEETRRTTLYACLEAGYFPEQAPAGLMVWSNNTWTHHTTETLHSLVLAHAELPWLGLGHSLGFSKLLDFSVRWHSLFSLHGFTRFTATDHHPEGTPPRVLARMIRKAEQNLPEVLADFHARCGHTAQWATLNEHSLLEDLQAMQTLDNAHALSTALSEGALFHAWAGTDDQIVPFALSQTCFNEALSAQGHTLQTLAIDHAGFASHPARYTDILLPLICRS